MKTVRVSEATNPQLNWLVAKCEGAQGFRFDGRRWRVLFGGAEEYLGNLDYTASWSLMGQIIERERICLRDTGDDSDLMWEADDQRDTRGKYRGPTPLIAAARCYVASTLGDVVEVPEELA